MAKKVMAKLFYDGGSLVGRVVEVEDLTHDQIREALDHGARWEEQDDWYFVIDQWGECALQTIWENQDWKEIKEQEIWLDHDDDSFEVVEVEEEEAK